MLFPANGPAVAALFAQAREAALARVAALSPVELRRDPATLVEQIRRECTVEPVELDLARATRQPGTGRDARIYISVPLRVDPRAGYRPNFGAGRNKAGASAEQGAGPNVDPGVASGLSPSSAAEGIATRFFNCRPQDVAGLPFNGFEGFVRDGAIVLTFDPAKDRAAAKTEQERIERRAEGLLGLFRAAVEGLNQEIRGGDVLLQHDIQRAVKQAR